MYSKWNATPWGNKAENNSEILCMWYVTSSNPEHESIRGPYELIRATWVWVHDDLWRVRP